MIKHVYLKTYGCQSNQYDSDKILDLLKPFGYRYTDDPAQASLAILNTCHIREKAEQKVLSDLGRLKKHKDAAMASGSDLIIGVGGCVGQAQGDALLSQAPYVSIVFGTQTLHRLPEYLSNLNRAAIVDTEFPFEAKFDALPATTESRASALLAIQEGCDKFCAFCCVPYTRGAEYSRPVCDVLKEAKHLVTLGAREIVLLGQNVNAYHGEAPVYDSIRQRKEWDLADLIEELAQIPDLKRIRYMTSHPRDMNDRLLEVHGSVDKLMPYMHLPVQSGSDRVLERMNRKHTMADYIKILEALKAIRPDIAVSSDFIAGHPGEAYEDHCATLQLIQGYIDTGYAFQYSRRPGTPASASDDQVPEGVKRERLHEIQAMLLMKQQSFNDRFVHQTVEILIEKKGKSADQVIGRSPYMQSVWIEGDTDMIGQFLTVNIQAAYQNSLMGVAA